MAFSALAAVAGYVISGLVFRYVYAIYLRCKPTASSRSRVASERPFSVHMGKKSHFTEDWWASDEHLTLEFRAVFSKDWLFATHSSRLRKPGDYHSVTIGRFPVLLVMGKDHTIRGFHDVCRHRAYKITRKSTGSTLVFGCRYHGWSYDTKGALVRAPEFEKVSTFRRDENGLFPVNTRISPEGLVFVNFHSGITVPHFQSDSLKNAIPQHIISPKATLIKELELDGAFNWKLVVDTSFGEADGQVTGTDLHIFPAARIYWPDTDPLWISLIHEPISSNKTRIRLDIYAVDSSATVLEPNLSTIEGQARSYVRKLKQLHGQLSSKPAKHVSLRGSFIDFQNEIELRTASHADAEKAAGGAIQSVMSQQTVSKQGLEDDMFCKQLEQECVGFPCDKANKKLAW